MFKSTLWSKYNLNISPSIINVADGIFLSLSKKLLIRPNRFKTKLLLTKNFLFFLFIFSIDTSIKEPGLTLSSFLNDNDIILKKLGRINKFHSNDLNKPSAAIVISGDLFKLFFDENVDLNLIKENLTIRQNKYKQEMIKISERLSNKGFVDHAPKNIVDQEKTNYNNLKNDVEKISLTIESL